MSIEQEEADIKEMIDKEYKFKEQECYYYKQLEEDYYKNNKINNYEIFDKRQRKQ